MKPEIWPTEEPFVVFMVPAEHQMEYALTMKALTTSVLNNLGWGYDSVKVIGLISSSPQHGTENLVFLEEMGVDTRSITLLMLWGDTAESVNFTNIVPEECGVGVIILPETGVSLPTVRMPALEEGWWFNPDHQEYAISVFADMIRNGRMELDGSEPSTFVSNPYIWN